MRKWRTCVARDEHNFASTRVREDSVPANRITYEASGRRWTTCSEWERMGFRVGEGGIYHLVDVCTSKHVKIKAYPMHLFVCHDRDEVRSRTKSIHVERRGSCWR
jgi:hypothetical protein